MTQPTPYRRGYDFSDAGGSTPPGGPLDGELDDVGRTLSHILRNLALIQRDDTALRNGIVGIDALDSRVLGLISGGTFSIGGTWVTDTAYPAGAFLTDDGAIYLVMEAHTSTSIVDDLAAGHIAKALQNEQGTRLRDDFVGNAVQTAFSLSQSPARPTDVEVYVDGALVLPDDYVQTGATVTFDVAPVNGAEISIFSITWATAPPIQTLIDAVGNRNAEITAATQFIDDIGDSTASKGASMVATEGGDDVQTELDARPTSAALAASGGAVLVGAGIRTQADVNAEIVSVFDYIPKAQQAAILAGTSTYDCTADIHAARDAVDGTGKTLRFPGGTYYVGEVYFTGSNYHIDTAGVTFQQKPGVLSAVPAVLRFEQSSDISMGDVNVIGNIATDTGENNHAVGLSQSKRITIGRIFATNVRGDALYCYSRNTSEAERQRDCYVEGVSGSNVYRNLLTVTGGQLRVGSVVNAGPVGYRDFDVEPNDASGTYEAVDLEIGYVKAGSCEITSDDATVINHAVRIGILDCDLDRVQATTPAYPGAPGSGAYAIGISRTETVQIGHFKARNYNGHPINLAFAWSVLDIGTLDLADCSLTDVTYNTMILQQGNAQGGAVRIGTLICDAANTKFLGRVVGTGLLKIEVANIRLMKCMSGVQITGRFANGQIDLNSGSAIAMVNSENVVFENVTTTGGGSATFLYQCSNIVAINSTLTFGTLDGGGTGSSNLTAINSSVNGSTADGVNMVLGGSIRIADVDVLSAQGAAIADATVAAGANPTKAEYDALVGKFNAVLARMRASTPSIAT